MKCHILMEETKLSHDSFLKFSVWPLDVVEVKVEFLYLTSKIFAKTEKTVLHLENVR